MTKITSENPMTSQNNEWVKRLETMAPQIDTWRERTREVEYVDPKSSLGADSRHGIDVQGLAWYQMCVASEHLDFTIGAIKATRTMYPTAYMTVVRTAYMSAVNAVWLLTPESRKERIRRAIELSADDLRGQLTYINTFVAPAGDLEESKEKAIQRIKEKQEALQKVADAQNIETIVSKPKFNQTEAIKWVANKLNEDNPILIDASVSIWRTTSAAAHGHLHYGMSRAHRNELTEGHDGRTTVKFRGDLDLDLGPAFSAAFLTLNRAFSDYDLRRVR